MHRDTKKENEINWKDQNKIETKHGNYSGIGLLDLFSLSPTRLSPKSLGVTCGLSHGVLVSV